MPLFLVLLAGFDIPVNPEDPESARKAHVFLESRIEHVNTSAVVKRLSNMSQSHIHTVGKTEDLPEAANLPNDTELEQAIANAAASREATCPDTQ